MKLPRQTLLPFGVRERVVNRQIRERAAGKKVRPGLGRPPKRRASSEDAVVAHTKRRVIGPKTAVHVTLSVTTKVPNLRTRKKYALVKRAFATAQFDTSAESPLGFRLIHFAVLGDHVHLLAEADSAQALAKGIQKITISMARLINVDGVRQAGGSVDPRAGSLRNRKGWIGKIFRDRYHAHYLTSEREMSSALTYLFSNAERHFGRNTPVTVSLIDQYGRRVRIVIDLFTSFAELQSADPPPITSAHGFLLKRAMRNTAWAVRHSS
jgi:adhesin HecA-like repeat protein